MKDWSGKKLCFACAKQLGANIEIGRKTKGRCSRCHSEQMLFKVTAITDESAPAEGDVCPECAHPANTHAETCGRSELAVLKRERQEIVEVLERFGGYNPKKPLAGQIKDLLAGARKDGPDR